MFPAKEENGQQEKKKKKKTFLCNSENLGTNFISICFSSRPETKLVWTMHQLLLSKKWARDQTSPWKSFLHVFSYDSTRTSGEGEIPMRFHTTFVFSPSINPKNVAHLHPTNFFWSCLVLWARWFAPSSAQFPQGRVKIFLPGLHWFAALYEAPFKKNRNLWS